MSIDRFGNTSFRTVRYGSSNIPLNNVGLRLQYHTPNLNVPYGSENRISFTNQSYSNEEVEIGAVAVRKGDANPGSYGGGEILFYTMDSNPGGGQTGDGLLERMRIDNKGRVGIGTSNTFGYKLAVNGTIGSTEIKIENTSAWPDFVFDSNYELRTLEEIEQHIKDNGHLPEMPNDAEVTENGINLGEMNAKLLQKIEELTLYLIEEHKNNQKLQEEVEKLKKEVINLKN